MRVVGLGNLNNSISLKLFIERAHDADLNRVVFDLAQCAGFDSTFMGILLGSSLHGVQVIVTNASDEHRKLLSEVGLDRIVRILKDGVDLPDGMNMRKLDDASIRPQDRTKHVALAHEELSKLSRENAERFGPFLELIRSELEEE